MKRGIVVLVASALLLSGGLARAQSDQEAQAKKQHETRELLEQKLRTQRKALQEAEEQLRETTRRLAELEGRSGESPRVRVMWLGNRARLGVVVGRDREDTDGARIVAVTPASPAEEAGLEVGDVILSIDGQALGGKGTDPAGRLVDLTRHLEEGQKVAVTYRRGKETRTVTVTARRDDEQLDLLRFAPDLDLDVDVRGLKDIGEPFELPELHALPPTWHPVGLPSRPWEGLEMVTLGAELGEYFGVKEGILVVSVPADGSLPLKPGDVIVTIGGRAPASPSQAMRIIGSYDSDQEIPVEVVRKRDKLTLTMHLPDPVQKLKDRQGRFDLFVTPPGESL